MANPGLCWLLPNKMDEKMKMFEDTRLFLMFHVFLDLSMFQFFLDLSKCSCPIFGTLKSWKTKTPTYLDAVFVTLRISPFQDLCRGLGDFGPSHGF